MDELFALLSAVKEGEVTEAEAVRRLSCSPHWVLFGARETIESILAKRGWNINTSPQLPAWHTYTTARIAPAQFRHSFVTVSA